MSWSGWRSPSASWYLGSWWRIDGGGREVVRDTPAMQLEDQADELERLANSIGELAPRVVVANRRRWEGVVEKLVPLGIHLPVDACKRIVVPAITLGFGT